MDVDALDPAAGLPRIEEDPIQQGRHGRFQIRIGAHPGRVLAAQFEAKGDELSRSGLLDGSPTFHRASEHACSYATATEHTRSHLVACVQMLEGALGQACGVEGALKLLGNQRRLTGVLENDGIASQERRHDRIHRREPGIVPGRHDKHRSHRKAAHETAEAGFLRHLEICKALFGQHAHGTRALLYTGKLACAEADRTADLQGQFIDESLFLRAQSLEKPLHGCAPFVEGHASPDGKRRFGSIKRRADRCCIGQRSLAEDFAVDRRDSAQHGHAAQVFSRAGTPSGRSTQFCLVEHQTLNCGANPLVSSSVPVFRKIWSAMDGRAE